MNNAKRALRASLLRSHRSLTDGERFRSDEQIYKRILQYHRYQNCTGIFLYASKGHEINTHDLIDLAVRQGKIVALPKSQPNGIMDFYEYTGLLKLGRFNIPEPTGEQILYPTENDLMIVPGLSFTPTGQRIGYGGGYYDRYLAKHPCVTVGLCRERFVTKELPVAWNDLPVDCVITDSFVYE